MPTKKPRINMVVEPRLFAAATRLAALTGKSASGVLRDLLEPSTPILEGLAAALEAVEVDVRDGKRVAVELIEAKARLLAGVDLISQEAIDQLSLFAESEGEGVGKGPTGPLSDALPEAEPTPLCNTGVTKRKSPANPGKTDFGRKAQK